MIHFKIHCSKRSLLFESDLCLKHNVILTKLKPFRGLLVLTDQPMGRGWKSGTRVGKGWQRDELLPTACFVKSIITCHSKSHMRLGHVWPFATESASSWSRLWHYCKWSRAAGWWLLWASNYLKYIRELYGSAWVTEFVSPLTVELPWATLRSEASKEQPCSVAGRCMVFWAGCGWGGRVSQLWAGTHLSGLTGAWTMDQEKSGESDVSCILNISLKQVTQGEVVIR